jgi:hypothetical protein
MLVMRIHTIANLQIDNMEKLLDNLSPVDNNESSHSGLIIACDRVYGKKKVIELLAKRNFKIITIANALGSEYPVIASNVVAAYRKKIHLYNITNAGRNNESSVDYINGVLESNLEEFDLAVAEFTLSDKETLLLGPEVIVCQHISMPSLLMPIMEYMTRKWLSKFYASLFMCFLDLKNYSRI